MTTDSIIGLVVLAFALSWDNFRSSVALWTVPFGLRRAVQVARHLVVLVEQRAAVVVDPQGDGRRARQDAAGEQGGFCRGHHASTVLGKATLT